MKDHDPLRDAAQALPDEIQPARDLWPGIQQQLDADESTSPGLTAWRARLKGRGAPAVGLLVAACLVVLVLAGPDRGPQSAAPLDVASLDQGYETVRTDVLNLLDDRCGVLPEQACDGLRSGLTELDHCASDLRQALRNAPGDSPEARRLAARYHRTVEKARGLAGHAARL